MFPYYVNFLVPISEYQKLLSFSEMLFFRGRNIELAGDVDEALDLNGISTRRYGNVTEGPRTQAGTGARRTRGQKQSENENENEKENERENERRGM